MRPQASDLDFVISSDHVGTASPEGHDGLERAPDPHTNLNTGVYFVRGTDGGALARQLPVSAGLPC
jgi:hypothetical protein